uniref:Legume lectin domain-containing protein n=1 Tax=Ananas comosus var. bracteatus TaxID=296719 RepID=A0A6V7NJF6_ANACO|nr:unnamed protein product [Ananas comosus var. bracteatus]
MSDRTLLLLADEDIEGGFANNQSMSAQKITSFSNLQVFVTTKGSITAELFKDASPDVMDKFVELCPKHEDFMLASSADAGTSISTAAWVRSTDGGSVGRIAWDSNMTLLGDASLKNGIISLTYDTLTTGIGAGGALYSRPVRFLDRATRAPASFATSFAFSIRPTCSSSSSADHLAPSPASATASPSSSPPTPASSEPPTASWASSPTPPPAPTPPPSPSSSTPASTPYSATSTTTTWASTPAPSSPPPQPRARRRRRPQEGRANDGVGRLQRRPQDATGLARLLC